MTYLFYFVVYLMTLTFGCFYVFLSPEDGHRSGPKHVVEVIHIKLQILL
jgi:hypothetical protein